MWQEKKVKYVFYLYFSREKELQAPRKDNVKVLNTFSDSQKGDGV